MNFTVCIKTAKFNLHLHPQCQRTASILHALLHDPLLATVDAGITHDTGINHCCHTLAQLVFDWEEPILASDFFHRFHEADEDAEEYAKNPQHLEESAFSGCPPNKVANWVTVLSRHEVQPSAMVEEICNIKTNSLGQLVMLATPKSTAIWRKEPFPPTKSPGFAEIASSLHELTEKQAKKNIRWEKEYDETFEEQKQTLCPTPILALPNCKSDVPPSILHTDVGDAAVGGVLSQGDKKAGNTSSSTRGPDSVNNEIEKNKATEETAYESNLVLEEQSASRKLEYGSMFNPHP
ncbi:hypothetical protein [Echinococcus multilocularis]|uniref:DUF5726 domain-containing protein n=1 Tax=Echinococcus multilocularis TaxID=6211 RepID=A0A068Y1T8_ECHMU|nr:hypothetical protein [Echinococcus multilocularis]